MLSKEPRAENIGDSNASNYILGVKVLIKELNSFREFQAKIESKLDNLEATIFTGKSKNGIQNVTGNADCLIFLLKIRITSLES